MPETALRVYRGTKYFSASLFEGSQRMSRRKQDHERGVKAPPDKEMAVASVRAPPTMSTGQISAPKASMICQGVPTFTRGSSFCAWSAARLWGPAPATSSGWAILAGGAPSSANCSAPVWGVNGFLDAPSGVAEGRTGACSVDYLVLMLKRSMAIRCECVEVESPLTAHASDCTHFSLRPALNVRSR